MSESATHPESAATGSAHDDDLRGLDSADIPPVEIEDINVGPIIRLIAGSAVVIGVLVVAVFQLVNLQTQTYEVASVPDVNPALQEARARAASQLNRYEAQGGGTYRIPIERAMDVLSREAYRGGPGGATTELPRQKDAL